jgi:hypothetical protein
LELDGERNEIVNNFISPEQFYQMIEKWKIIFEKDGYTVRCNGFEDHVVILDAQKGKIAISKCNCKELINE